MLSPAPGGRLLTSSRYSSPSSFPASITVARISGRRPGVVTLGLAGDVEGPVDGGGAAEPGAAGIEDRAPRRPGIGLGPVAPGEGRVVEHLHKAGRDVDERVPVAPARLDQHHP